LCKVLEAITVPFAIANAANNTKNALIIKIN